LSDAISRRQFRPGARGCKIYFLIPFTADFSHRVGMATQRGWFRWQWALMLFIAVPVFAEPAPVKLDVDATEAARGILHARLHIPAPPGRLTLFYPKWIPGEHAPTGPINEVTALQMTANGRRVDWRRDADDMFTFHLTVPAGADAVEVALDLLLPPGGSSTARLLDLNWNQVLLYPQTASPLKLSCVATLQLPAGWKFGTALPIGISTRSRMGEIAFLPAPLETLIDSPVIAGEFFRTVDLTPGENPPHFLHIVADSAAALDLKPEDVRAFSRLVKEENALFGAHHYRDYHFLLTLSDHVAHFGLEHHESSDNRTDENFLTDADVRTFHAELLPHEMAHSWNGKFRRPAGIATPDYQQPMEDELLWVYEGLTDYLGKVLAVRSGLQTNANFHDGLALTAAMLDHRSGREWRSLADTAISAQLLYGSPGTGANRRRSVDFYPEGDLIWLEADTLIRQQTQGKKSLDDFCKAFHGGENSAPKVVPYNFDDVVNGLNSIAPYDWKMFFQKRIYDLAPRAPVGGIENGGWRLAYTNEVTPFLKIHEGQRKVTDMSYSLGLVIGTDGNLGDVLPGTPADKAGISPNMKLVAVNGRSWSAKILRDAVKTAATNRAPIELLVERDDYYQTCKMDYHGGEKYPVLERDPAKPDLLAEILKPLAPEPGTNSPAGK
jgi:predicted metalloprotease with PDZ domain